MFTQKIDLLGAAVFVVVMALLPLLLGNTYLTGVLTVAAPSEAPPTEPPSRPPKGWRIRSSRNSGAATSCDAAYREGPRSRP